MTSHSFDKRAGAMYIRFLETPTRPLEQICLVDVTAVADHDADGRVVGLEVLSMTRAFTQTEFQTELGLGSEQAAEALQIIDQVRRSVAGDVSWSSGSIPRSPRTGAVLTWSASPVLA
jgi:hypothetical protein